MENNIKKRKILGDGICERNPYFENNKYARPPKLKTLPVVIPANKYYLDLDVLYDGILDSFKDQKLRDLKEGERYGVILRVNNEYYESESKGYRAHFTTNQDELDKVLFEVDNNDYTLKLDFVDGIQFKEKPLTDEDIENKAKEREIIIKDGLGRLIERSSKYEDTVMYSEKYTYDKDGSVGTHINFSNGNNEYSYYDIRDKTITKYKNGKLVKVCYGCEENDELKCNYYVNYRDGKITSKGFNKGSIEFIIYIDEKVKL